MNTLQLLRNTTLYSTHEQALAAVKAKAASLQDGEMWVATYGTNPDAKSLLAVKRDNGVTIFDNEGSSNVITEAINNLDSTVKANLNSDSTSVEQGKHVGVKLEQENGVLKSLTILENDIASASVVGTSNDDATTDTLFGKLKKVEQNATNAISGLAYTDNKVAKKFVTSVSQTNGVVSVERAEVKSTDKTVSVTSQDNGDIVLGVNVDNTTITKNDDGVLSVVSSALTQYSGVEAIKVENAESGNSKNVSLKLKDGEKVLTQSAEGLTTTISLVSVTPNSETVKEEYELQGANGQKLGTQTIKIYKDSSFKEIYLGTSTDTVNAESGVVDKKEGDKQSLNYVYLTSEGKYALVSVDVSTFLSEAEAGNGIEAVNHKFNVKLDSSSEDNLLSVSENGLKLSGVGTKITNALGNLTVSNSTASDSNNFITTKISQTNGKISNEGVDVTYGNFEAVQTNGLATTSSVKTYVDNAVSGSAVTFSNSDYITLNKTGNTVTATPQTGGLSVTGEGASAKLAGEENKLVTASELATNLNSVIEKVTTGNNASLASTVGSQTVETNKHVAVEVVQTNGKLTGLTITENDIASAKVVADNEKVTSAALNDLKSTKADKTELEKIKDSISGAYVGKSGVEVTSEDGNNVIKIKLDPSTSSLLTVSESGLKLGDVIDLGTY